ncbi:chromosome transmission fidelity protein 18, partial [Phenoliferia sp. Uapishka_3]
MVVSRLRNICAEENLKADTKSLTMLTEIAEGDLRSCLNTLQFIKRRSTVVDEAAINKTSIGKDMKSSSNAVVSSLFKKPQRLKGGNSNVDEKYVNRIVRDADTCGEVSQIVTGCFENYLGAKQTNDGWPRITEALDWLFFWERLERKTKSEGDHALFPYIPFAFPAFHHLFATHTAKKLEFTKADYESHLQHAAHREILESFHLYLPHHVKFHFTASTIATELIPQLNRILAPDLKPVNSQLIKSEERAVMLKLVNTMITMRLSYVPTKNEEGQPTYKLDPPIDVFVHYEGKRAEDIAASRYAVRHMISNEMAAEDMRRSDGGANATTAEEILAAYQPKSAVVVAVDVKEAVDFFKRPLIAKAKTEEEERSTKTRATAFRRGVRGLSTGSKGLTGFQRQHNNLSTALQKMSEESWTNLTFNSSKNMDPPTSGIVLLTKGNLVAKSAALLHRNEFKAPSEFNEEERREWQVLRQWEEHGPIPLLLHEASIYERLGAEGHPGVIRSHGLSTLEDGRLALILDRACLGSVDAYLNKRGANAEGARTPLRQRLRWCAELAEAVAFVHSRHVAIIDLNSNNVLIDISSDSPSPRVKLCDFGAADPFDASGPPRAFVFTTHSPTSFASPKFKLFSKAQKDMFSMGSTIVEILLNSHPWSGMKSAEVGRLHESHVFPDLSNLPDAVRRIIFKCWKLEFSDVDAAARALREAQSSLESWEGIDSPFPPTIPRTHKRLDTSIPALDLRRREAVLVK